MAGGMGKKAGAAKKAGAVKKTGVTIPPTKRRSGLNDKTSSLRSNKVTSLLNMRKQKIKRDPNTGEIVKGSVLDASDKIPKGGMARIAPDRKWFGAPRVIGQDAMQKFRDEMEKKLKDPYSVLLKPAKLPLSLLEEPKTKPNLLERKELNFKGTFGKTARRKRVELSATNIDEMQKLATEKSATYKEAKDRQLLSNVARESDPLTMTAPVERDMTIDRNPFDKGQSGRIWNQLWKVIDSSDVILQVLDARDPMGTRSSYLENYLQKEKKFKHLIFVLNKVDLVPTWVTARWLQILSKDRPTIAFHASMNHPFGKGNLINLLRQFSRLHGCVKGKKGGKKTISVGLIGYPNVGKSSVINTIRSKKVCNVAPIPGETKVWQYVNLTKSIFMIDCPGVIHDSDHKNNDVEAVLKGVVRVERMGQADKDEVIKTILDIIKTDDLRRTYDVENWTGSDDFLEKIAFHRGKLLRGGVPDKDSAARMVIHDWIRGRLPWFNAPPFESNQQFRDHQLSDETILLKKIQNYSTFNIVNEELKNKIEQEEQGIEVEEEEDEESNESDSEGDAIADRLNNEREDVSDNEENSEENDTELPPAKRVRKEESNKKSSNQKTGGLTPWEALQAAAAAKATSTPAKTKTTAAEAPKKKIKLVKKK